MKRFLVCNFCHDDCSVNANAVRTTFEEAFQTMLQSINRLLKEYSSAGRDVKSSIYADSAVIIIDGDVVYDWKIQPIDVQPTEEEAEETFRKVRHQHIVREVIGYLNGTTHICSASTIDAIAELMVRKEDRDIPYNDFLEFTVEQYLADNGQKGEEGND